MRAIYFNLFFLLFFIAGCNNVNTVDWFNGNLDEAYLLADDKIIMIDFYTDW